MKNKEQKYVLSKSTFIRGCQCEKSLWLYKYKYKMRKISVETQIKFDRGHRIGIIAQQLFPGGVDSSSNNPWEMTEAVKNTRNYLFYDKKIIYEAAFGFDGVYVAIDILAQQNNMWTAFEVKSSENISDTYILDAALQYFVITKSGFPLKDFKIVYLNSDYIKENNIDINEFDLINYDLNSLFVVESVLDRIKDLQNFIAEKYVKLKNVISAPEPQIGVGEQCSNPYQCDYWEYCHYSLF